MSLRLPLLFAVAVLLVAVGASAVAANRGLPVRVTWFEDPQQEAGTEVPGAYVVQQRGYFSMTAHVHLRGLTPGHRYSLWWVVYDNPQACVDGCDLADVDAALLNGTNPARIGVHFGGSFVVSSGRLDVGTRILEDAITGCQASLPYSKLCVPLTDAAIAEATILVHDHGPATAVSGPILVSEMFSNGCKSYKRLDTVVATYADSGYDCFSPQSVHLP